MIQILEGQPYCTAESHLQAAKAALMTPQTRDYCSPLTFMVTPGGGSDGAGGGGELAGGGGALAGGGDELAGGG